MYIHIYVHVYTYRAMISGTGCYLPRAPPDDIPLPPASRDNRGSSLLGARSVRLSSFSEDDRHCDVNMHKCANSRWGWTCWCYVSRATSHHILSMVTVYQQPAFNLNFRDCCCCCLLLLLLFHGGSLRTGFAPERGGRGGGTSQRYDP